MCDKESTKGNWECNLVPFKGFSLLSFLANFPNFKGKSLGNEFTGNKSREANNTSRHVTLVAFILPLVVPVPSLFLGGGGGLGFYLF